MQLRPIVPVLIVLAMAVSCTKKETALPAAKSATTVDAPKVSDNKTLFPFTDTFKGKFSVSLYAPSMCNFDSVDNAYSFYVTYLDQHTIVFSSSKKIELQPGSAIAILDTFYTGNDSVYNGTMSVWNIEHKRPDLYPNALAFKFSQNTLSVSWEILYMPLIGACDEGMSNGMYTGINNRK